MIWFRLFFEFFKIGLFTFGGGYAMIPLIKEAVLKYGWLSEDLFYDFIGVCESTPGPIAVNFATFVGASQKGFLGAVVATLGVIIAPFFIIVLISSILNHIIDKNKLSNYHLNVKECKENVKKHRIKSYAILNKEHTKIPRPAEIRIKAMEFILCLNINL